MAYEMVMPYHLHMPSYFLETFTEYPCGNLRFLYCFSPVVKKRHKKRAKVLIKPAHILKNPPP